MRWGAADGGADPNWILTLGFDAWLEVTEDSEAAGGGAGVDSALGSDVAWEVAGCVGGFKAGEIVLKAPLRGPEACPNDLSGTYEGWLVAAWFAAVGVGWPYLTGGSCGSGNDE